MQKLFADNEEIDIRMYSIIYDAINDLKDAEGRYAFLQRLKRRLTVYG